MVSNRSRTALLTSWGTYFGRRGLIPASLNEAAHNGDCREGAWEEERRLLTLLTAAYTGPLTVARAIHEHVLPGIDSRAAEDGSLAGKKQKKPFRPRSGQSNRKGMPHHHEVLLPARSTIRRQIEVHVLGAAGQEETLLPTYYPEIGLLFPELSIREYTDTDTDIDTNIDTVPAMKPD
jgi:hypothetical protein